MVDVSPSQNYRVKTAQVAREGCLLGEDYLSLSVVHESSIFTFSFKTSRVRVSEAADEATAFMGILNKSGQVRSSARLPNIPHDNGGFHRL